MTGARRQELRHLVDEAVRARQAPLIALWSTGNHGCMFCTECGIGKDNWTPGCRACGDRWRRWLKVGMVSALRFLEEKVRVEDYAYEARVRAGGFASNGKPPATTWGSNRRNFGLPSRILPL